jgi:hypothetical protein
VATPLPDPSQIRDFSHSLFRRDDSKIEAAAGHI